MKISLPAWALKFNDPDAQKGLEHLKPKAITSDDYELLHELHEDGDDENDKDHSGESHLEEEPLDKNENVAQNIYMKIYKLTPVKAWVG